MTTVQIKKRNLTWVYGFAGSRRQRKITSADLRRTINAPTWADFHLFLQKKLTTKVYKTKRSLTEWFISSINWETKKCLHVCARAYEKGGKMRWRARPTTNHSHEWTNRFSSGMEPTQRISTNQTKSRDFCVNEEQKRLYEGGKKAIV